MSERELAPQPNIEILTKVDYPEYWNQELVDQLFRTTPEKSEVLETPLVELDLSQYGYGVIYVKNEGFTVSNPTGTFKDRMARHVARKYIETLKNERFGVNVGEPELAERKIERCSIITMGNAGKALTEAFKDLPPPKLLMDKSTSPEILEELKKLRADIYLTDLSVNPFSGKPSEEDPLTREQILMLTDNEDGFELTSAPKTNEMDILGCYRELVESVVDEKPNHVYMPYGSGLLFDNFVSYLRWEIAGRQMKADKYFSIQDDNSGDRFALAIDIPAIKYHEYKANQLATMAINGIEPESVPSIADKLACRVKPFRHFTEEVIKEMQTYTRPNENSHITKVSEEEIKAAYEFFTKIEGPDGIQCEPSSIVGLAQYMKDFKTGKIKPKDKVMIINTGKGIISE